MDPVTLWAFCIIAAWFITSAIEAGADAAVTECRRLREDIRRTVTETTRRVNEAGNGSPASSPGWWALWAGAAAARSAWRSKAGRRIARAAWDGGKTGARLVWENRRRPRGERNWTPRIRVCGGCGLAFARPALRPFGTGRARRKLCPSCWATATGTPRGSAELGPGQAAPAPAGREPVDAVLVPDPAPAPPAAGPAPAPEPVRNPDPSPAITDPATQPGSLPAGAPAGNAVAQPTASAISTGGSMANQIGLPPGTRALPSAGGGGGYGTGGESRTHGAWLSSMGSLQQRTAELAERMQGITARLHAADGGRTQVNDIIGWERQTSQFLDMLHGIVAAIDPPERQLIAAIPNGDVEEICEIPYYANGAM